MRQLCFGLLLLTGCATEMMAPPARVLRLVPAPVLGLFTASVASVPATQPFSAGAAAAGQAVSVTLLVVDQNDNTVPGVSVYWSVAPGAGSAAQATSISDSSGAVSVKWTLDTIAKLDSMQASLTAGTGLLVTANGVHAGAAGAIKVSGDSQTVAVGTSTTPLVLRAVDRFGNPISHLGVAWAVIAGDGTLSQITSSTGADGTTQATVKVGSVPGDFRVVATFGVMPALIFSFKAQ